MKCPKCGREVLDNASYCAVCGSPVGVAYAQAQHAVQEPLREKKGASTALIVVIIVVVVAIVGIVVWSMFDSSSSSSFTADLQYEVLTYGVEVNGRIYNHGLSDAVAVLHLRIFDGTDWHEYDVNTGLVPANGFRYLEYVATGLDTSDSNSVNVQYTLSGG